MRQKLTNMKMMGSLIFPGFICLLFGTLYVLFSVDGAFYAFGFGCLFSALLGGLLPIVITLITKTDTSHYLKNRAVTLLLSLFLAIVAWILGLLFDTVYCFWIELFLSVIMLTFYYTKKAGNGLERLIIIISNPILYLAICFACFGCDIITAFSQ